MVLRSDAAATPTSGGGPLTAVGQRVLSRAPRYLLSPNIKQRRVKSPKAGLRRRSAVVKRLIVVPEDDGYDPPRQRIRYRLGEAVARHAKREAHLRPWLPPLGPGPEAAAALEGSLATERRVIQSNTALRQQSVTPILADTEDTDGDDEATCGGRRVPGARKSGHKTTIDSCRWGRMTLTPGEMAALYGVAPSVANVYSLWELSLFAAIDTRIPLGLVREEPLQHLKLVPCSPGSLFARSCPTLLRAPPLDSPARDMYRVVRAIALERPPRTEKGFTSFRQYHAHLFGPHANTVLQGWYFPCEHPGKCTVQNCCCIRSFNFCTPLCCNGVASSNAFKGCSCSAGCRQSPACTCRRSNRECDPTVCRCEGCVNTELQQPARPTLRVAESTVPNCGRGAFAVQPLGRGALVGEYVGELISEAECARRSPVQRSILGHNHMAQVTTDVVIDASRLGNDLRYINHSTDPNCEMRSVFVWTRWRLAIYTLRDIAAGEELFFDYGPTFFPRPLSSSPVPSIKYITAFEGSRPAAPPSNGKAPPDDVRRRLDLLPGGDGEPDGAQGGEAEAEAEAEGSASSTSDVEESSSSHDEGTGSIVAVFAGPGEYWLGQALEYRKGQVLLQWLDHVGDGHYTFLPTSDWVRSESVLVDGVPMVPRAPGWVVEDKTRAWLERTASVLRKDKWGKVVAAEDAGVAAAEQEGPEGSPLPPEGPGPAGTPGR